MKKNSPQFRILLLFIFTVLNMNCDKQNPDPPEVYFVVSAGFNGTDASLRYSETGINWPADYSTFFSQTYLINGLAYGDNYFVGVGNGLYSYQSADGINWNQTDLDSIVTYWDIALGEYHNQTPWAPYFVAVGENGAAMFSSTHGKFWDPGTTGITEDLKAVTFGLTGEGLSMFVAVGDAPPLTPIGTANPGTIIYSITAGETWINHSNGGTTRDLHCVAFGGGRFIAAGDYAVMFYSLNGSYWEPVESNSTKHIYGIAYGTANNSPIWVAVGQEGAVLYSQDNGENWVEQVYDPDKTWRAVINANNKFYAVGYSTNYGNTYGVEGEIIISNNGIDWFTAATFPNIENYFRDIVYKN